MYALSLIDSEGQYEATAILVSETMRVLQVSAQELENSDAEDEDRDPVVLNWAEDGDALISNNIHPGIEFYYRIYKVGVAVGSWAEDGDETDMDF